MNNNSSLSDWLASKGFPLLDRLTITNSFKPAVQVNDLIFVSSATPLQLNGTEIIGKVGSDVNLEIAQRAACFCLSHSLTLVREVIGEPIDKRIVRAVDLTFFINAVPNFDNHSEIADAASKLLIGGLGSIGEHSRSAIGVGSLVRNVSVVLKAVYQISI